MLLDSALVWLIAQPNVLLHTWTQCCLSGAVHIPDFLLWMASVLQIFLINQQPVYD